MTDLRDPAARLHAVLVQLRWGNTTAVTIKDRVRAAFDARSDAEIFERLSAIVALPTLASEAIMEAADKQDVSADERAFYLQWHPSVQAGLGQIFSLDAALVNVTRHIGDQELAQLQAASFWLRRSLRGGLVTDSDLGTLRETAERLMQDIEGSTALADDLKLALIAQLQKILDALRAATISGVAALTDAGDTARGAIIRVLMQTPAPTDPQGQSLLKRFAAYIATLAAVVGVTGGILQIPGQAAEAFAVLTAGAGTSEVETVVEP